MAVILIIFNFNLRTWNLRPAVATIFMWTVARHCLKASASVLWRAPFSSSFPSCINISIFLEIIQHYEGLVLIPCPIIFLHTPASRGKTILSACKTTHSTLHRHCATSSLFSIDKKRKSPSTPNTTQHMILWRIINGSYVKDPTRQARRTEIHHTGQ